VPPAVVGASKLFSVALSAAALIVLVFGQAEAEAKKHPKPKHPAKVAANQSHPKSPKNGCRKEKPQRFLVRGSFIKHGMLDATAHRRALRWRAEKYGSIEGLGLEAYNSETAISQAAHTTFMGLPISVHQKIVPKLRCVEREIKKSCNGKDERYVAHGIGGFRDGNTYRGGEVSNHLFGIAIDIDSERNPCCGCVDPWPTNQRCNHGAESVYEKTELTKCWIDAFEQHGFYWLGHDTLQDTMHFEYLGDPDR
jgi:hypothetical protein